MFNIVLKFKELLISLETRCWSMDRNVGFDMGK